MLGRSLKTLVSLSLLSVAFALNNGVGVTPAMGYNPYNAFLFVQNVSQSAER
jgi:hypothetical protein